MRRLNDQDALPMWSRMLPSACLVLLGLTCQAAPASAQQGPMGSPRAIELAEKVAPSKARNRKDSMSNTELYAAAEALAEQLVLAQGKYGSHKMLLVSQGSYKDGWTVNLFTEEVLGRIRVEADDKGIELGFFHAVEDATEKDARGAKRDIRLLIENGRFTIDIVYEADIPKHMIQLLTIEELDAMRVGKTVDEMSAANLQREDKRLIAYSELYFGDAQLIAHNLPIFPGSGYNRTDIRTGEDIPWPEGEQPEGPPEGEEYKRGFKDE